MEYSDMDSEVLAEARQQFASRLHNHPVVKVRESEYELGVLGFSDDLRRMALQISDEISSTYGRPLSYNQTSIALISAMNSLKLIEVSEMASV